AVGAVVHPAGDVGEGERSEEDPERGEDVAGGEAPPVIRLCVELVGATFVVRGAVGRHPAEHPDVTALRVERHRVGAQHLPGRCPGDPVNPQLPVCRHRWRLGGGPDRFRLPPTLDPWKKRESRSSSISRTWPWVCVTPPTAGASSGSPSPTHSPNGAGSSPGGLMPTGRCSPPPATP